MAKRFTDTNKYKKPFVRGLKGAYKIFWDYLYHDCDHAGIWIVDFDIAQIYVGFDMPINKDDALKYFNKDEVRIIQFSNNTKWFIPSFVEFQYGELNPTNRAHNSVINLLKKNDLFKHLISPLEGAKDKDKEKDMVKDMDMVKYMDMVKDDDVEKIKKNGFHNIDKLIDVYLKDEKLCNAFISNKENKITSKQHLEKRLQEFKINLTEQGRHSETWKEFTTYFRNWNKLVKKQSKVNNSNFNHKGFSL